jgi:DNA-binding transcriptional ArsR family regulator
MASIRVRILRFLVDREEAGGQSGPSTAGEIAKALDEPLRAVVRQLPMLQGFGLVELTMDAGPTDEDIAVCVKPPAHVYLKANEGTE